MQPSGNVRVWSIEFCHQQLIDFQEEKESLMFLPFKHVVIVIIILGIILVIISENRNPVKTIAWCLVLTFMPILGIILYILFGMDNRHRRLIKDDELNCLKNLTAEVQQKEIVTVLPHGHESLSTMLVKANKAFPLSGNNVQIITDFNSMSDQLLKDIAAAKHHINMLFFKFEDDAVGRKIADALKEKAKEGVQVRLIYDDAGNMMVPRRFYKKLKDNAIQVRPF